MKNAALIYERGIFVGKLLFQAVAEFLFEMRDFRPDDGGAVTFVGMLIIIVEMVSLSAIELVVGRELRHNFAVPAVGRSGLFDGVFGDLLLLRVAVKNRAAVLRAGIVALIVELCWVMHGQENVHQLVIRNHFRIVNYVDGFGVTGIALSDAFVSRVLGIAALITGLRAVNAFDLIKNRVHAPKTAAREGRGALAGFGHDDGRWLFGDVFGLGARCGCIGDDGAIERACGKQRGGDADDGDAEEEGRL